MNSTYELYWDQSDVGGILKLFNAEWNLTDFDSVMSLVLKCAGVCCLSLLSEAVIPLSMHAS